MVYFICASCQETLKMAAVAKHHCYAPLSCVDCGKDFSTQTYRQHNACMTEAQKYQGALYKQPKGKKVDPQELWTGAVGAAAERGGKHKGLLQRLVGYPNVPRKRAKFLNFAKNSLGVRDERGACGGRGARCGATRRGAREGAGGAWGTVTASL
jgi:cell growth-regulating nucleolar protein